MSSPRSTSTTTPRPGTGRGVAALALAATLVLASCGGGGDDDAAEVNDDDRSGSDISDVSGDASDVSDDQAGDGDGSVRSGEAISYLPFDADAPSGFRMVTDECKAEDDSAEDEDDEDAPTDYTSPIIYAVPEDWTSAGRSSGGSGSMLGTSVDLTFRTADGDDVNAGYDWDNRLADGTIQGPDSKPWTTFDYDYSIGDDKVRIEYEVVAEVTIGGEEVEIFYMDPSQAPDHVSSVEYKARVPVTEIIDPSTTSSGTSESSFVFTVTFDPETSEVTHETVEAIVGSLSMPQCQWDEFLIREESFRDLDLNGDGEVKSMQEMQAEMQAELEEMMAEQQAELEAED